MLIYLNRTGFNGLFRLNRQGAFNVPVGRYTNPRICDPEHLRVVAQALRFDGVTIERGSFEAALERVRKGDFVYCDPPYAPLSATASFAQYTAQGFSALDQLRLQRAVTAAFEAGRQRHRLELERAGDRSVVRERAGATRGTRDSARRGPAGDQLPGPTAAARSPS